MDALKEWWKQLSFKDAYSWTDEEEEFASHGMSYPKAERLRFRKIVELIKTDIRVATAIVKGKQKSVEAIGRDPEGWVTIMDGEEEHLREQEAEG
ncbi:uncharacterized protein CLAFUR5_12651 [Fulvia fulva]|uniref:Uncharacterized protein n=1 Tax=Passalora fulva TaxID=5499 RepID=A0A9Q8UUW1_PASFU|nr:uncharacterized protein CLAFUR5_12651 [Fulvia fulva]KAK4612978.1 hypothetical protein CLAFUR0_12794 [Fulvia fulva]UJO23366.1 hypothetical protein CLAFUR5_12651 [Fulvia fulva]WPV36444.1 hypothetical protein CLAFUW7_12791 [Fulvia fulva]